MTPALKIVAVVVLLGAALAAGYWWGARDATQTPAGEPAAATMPEARKKPLYYRNPMGLPDTSPVPKKDPMGMDYIPVYEDEAQAATDASQIRITAERVQKLGVRTEPAAMRAMTRRVRAVGTLAVDERRITTVAPKFEGWIERLHVNTTGEAVAAGAPLMDVYSPELVTAQQEYLIAAKGVDSARDAGPEIQASMRRLMAGALERLRNWDISERELIELERGSGARRTLTLRSPVSGVVVEKPALKGMRFMPGEPLYQISDLSSLWVLADIFEQDLGMVQPGQPARITVDAFPDKVFHGRVAFLYPTLAPETRTGKLRIELANPGGVLKPAMYATVEIASGGQRPRLAVPASAVLDSGLRRIVFVQVGEGRFEAREVKLGMRADEYVEVLEGVEAGEPVVVAANFLIDAESNLRAAIASLGTPSVSGAAAGPAPKPGPSVGHRGDGTLDAIDAKASSATITHGPIPSLKWPGMTMDFALANTSLAAGIAPGAAIEFEFVERKPGEYVITSLKAKRA
ncbi:MAG: efflux RND transporter periplasmic adaptor subunit, partial [Betaproteobacteria bacterium]